MKQFSTLKWYAMCTLLLSLWACQPQDELNVVPLEQLQKRDFADTLLLQGELKSAETTPLNVPGSNFEQRRIVFMLPDGARVEQGELIARFEADAVKKDLSQQELELLRNTLKLANEKTQAGTQAAQILTERSVIEGDLDLSERYAALDANASWVSKNELLDKLQDLGLLQNKRETIDWRVGHQQEIAAAGSEVTLAQRESVQALVERNRASLASLELRAPHAGVFRLNVNWDGSKAQVGASAWAGDDFASLPDLSSLLARFSLPQSEASGLKLGQRVEIRLSGTGKVLPGTLARIGASASVRSRESPVKYLDLEASFDAKAVAEFQLTPGMAVSGIAYRVEAKDVLTVPNTALRLAVVEASSAQAGTAPPPQLPGQVRPGGQRDAPMQRGPRGDSGSSRRTAAAPPLPESAAVPIEKDAWVLMADGSERAIRIGVQGSARSIVLSGLQAGETIQILYQAAERKSS